MQPQSQWKSGFGKEDKSSAKQGSLAQKFEFSFDTEIKTTKDHFVCDKQTQTCERITNSVAQIVSCQPLPKGKVSFYDIKMIQSEWFAMGVIVESKRDNQWNSNGQGGLYIKSNGASWLDGMYVYDHPGFKNGTVVRTTVDFLNKTLEWKVGHHVLKKVKIPERFFKEELYAVVVARRNHDKFKKV